MKKRTLCHSIFLSILVISVLLIIFKGTESLFHSDDATVLLIAREQILQKKLILNDWNHSTVLWTIGLQTFIIPFLLFIKDWILCRELAVIVQTALFLLVVYKMMKAFNIRERLFCLALCILPVSEEILEHTFFQATYLTFQLFYYTILLLMLSFYKKADDKKKSFMYGVLCVLAIIIGCHSNPATISATTVPLFVALCLYYLIENFILFQKKKPDKKIVSVGILLIGGTLSALFIYVLLCKITGFDFASAGVSEFIGRAGYGLKINEYIDEFLLLYGGVGENSLFSIEGILRVLRIFYMILMCILIPVYLLWNYKKLEGIQKLFFLYASVTYVILTMVALLTGKCSSRYFIPVYFNNIILFGIFCKNMEEKFGVLVKMIQVPVAVAALCCSIFYLNYNYEENKNEIGMWRSGFDTADAGLVDFLEENDIHFMYAPYWNAYSNMVISDGRVQAMAYDGSEPMKMKQWLNSDRWCEPEYFNGRTAVLFLPTVELNQAYWDLASEYLQYGKWNILVFDQNLLLYDELKELREERKKETQSSNLMISGEELKCTGNAEKKGNSVYLYKEGIQKWNSCNLEEGEYLVTVRGENIQRCTVFSYYLDDAGRIMGIDMKKVKKEQEVIEYQITLEEARKVEFYEKNEIDEVMRIDGISVKKIP